MPTDTNPGWQLIELLQYARGQINSDAMSWPDHLKLVCEVSGDILPARRVLGDPISGFS
ncbi:MAG: hypothetical protein IPP47_28995 [Bryobacterales bacterium]|nr:hypothetical protein [Bryobacterales bacterium]